MALDHAVSILRRRLCAAALAQACVPVLGQGVATPALRVQRLSWAGVRVVLGDTTIVADASAGMAPPHPPGRAPWVPDDAGTRWRYALITNLLNDHYDPATLRRVLGPRGRVVCLEANAASVASDGLRVRPVHLWEPVLLGGDASVIVVTAVPCADGFGEPGVMWVLRGGERRLLHGGDVLWHAHWWRIAAQLGPFDAAFLPINGVVFQGTPPHVDIARTLTPEQAVAACVALGARRLCPIHHGLNDPPGYVETPDALARAARAATGAGIVLSDLGEGDWLDWNDRR